MLDLRCFSAPAGRRGDKQNKTKIHFFSQSAKRTRFSVCCLNSVKLWKENKKKKFCYFLFLYKQNSGWQLLSFGDYILIYRLFLFNVGMKGWSVGLFYFRWWWTRRKRKLSRSLQFLVTANQSCRSLLRILVKAANSYYDNNNNDIWISYLGFF